MKIIVRLLVCGLGIAWMAGAIYWWQKEQKNKKMIAAQEKAAVGQQKLISEFYQKLGQVENQQQLEFLIIDYPSLPVEIQTKIKPIIDLKKAVYAFDKAEIELSKTLKLVEAMGESGPSALVLETYFHSLELYKEAKIAVDQLNEIKGDDEYNFSLDYLKGEVYYRILQLVALPEEALDIFNQTVDAFKKALLIRPRDINTEINVEILRKNKDALLAKANVPGDQQMKQLIQQGVGSGQKRGNF